MTHFMIDIETTGVSPDCEILEIGVVHMVWEAERQQWAPKDTLLIPLFYAGSPSNAFAKRYMGSVYRRSNLAPHRAPESVRDTLLGFFESCGAGSRDQFHNNVKMVGWNLGSFDLKHLERKGLLLPTTITYNSHTGKDESKGDYSHRCVDLSTLIWQAELKRGAPGSFRTFLKKVGKMLTHSAVDDCLNQIEVLNILLEDNWS